MFTISDVSFDVDFSDALVGECTSWIRQCKENKNETELWDGIMLGYVIIKHGFSRLITERENKRQKTGVDVLLEQVKQDMHIFHQQQLARERANSECEMEAIHKRWRFECDMLRDQLQKVRDGVEQDKHTAMQYMNERIDTLSGTVQEHKQLISSKEAEIRALNERIISNYKDGEVKRLHDEISRRDNEIDKLKNTNFCKGIIGETMVRDVLARAFPDHTLLDKSGIATESDIHLVNKQEEIIAIECKYKAIITLDDVKKAVRDVGTLSEKYGKQFVAYVFYSLKSVNIPQKGFLFEMINGVPVLWYGTSMDENPGANEDLVFIAKTAQLLANVVKSNTRDLDDVGGMLNSNLERIAHNKRLLGTMTDAVASLGSNLRLAAENNTAVFNTIMAYMQDRGMAQSMAEQPDISCDKCKRKFKRRCDYTKHKCT